MFNAGVRGRRAKDTTGILTVGDHFNQQSFLIPTVTRFAITDGSYVDTDDIAANTTGNQTIVLYGSGFAPGATVLVGSNTIGAVTFLDSGRLAFSSPALGSGSYTIFVTNANGGTGILVPGLVYSGVPTFTTAAGSLGNVYETTAINTTVVATGDAPITYALSSGSLPSGSTLSSGGTISGTAPVDGSSTTYSFTVRATDVDNQDSIRSFSLTINTDVVSFSLPANNTLYSVTQNSPISNVTTVATSAAGYGVLYTSSGLPTGLSMNTSTGIISGTPTVVASNTTIITATANTTTRTAALYLNWTINLPGDAFWKYASLLMSANSAPNGNTFNTDASTINNEVVVIGDTKPSEFHPFKEGYYSNFFDGTGDYLAILTSSAFNIATNSFTVEAWINTSSATLQTIFNISDTGSLGYGAVRVQVLADKTVQWLMGPGGSWGVNVIAGSIVLGAWNHIAITRNGSSVYFFINGLQVGTTQTYATSLTTGGTTYIGFNSGTSYAFNGYISNLRFVNGTALYTANTTLSTSPLTYVANTSLLTCQSNRLIDNSNNNFTIVKGGDTTVSPFVPFDGTPTTVTVPGANNYSVYFDGTGDYLTTPVNAGFDMGTEDFTVECFVINYGYSGSQYGRGLFTIYTSGNYNNSRFMVRLRSGNDAMNIYGYNGSSIYFGATGTNGTALLDNSRQWYHIAVVRQSGVFKLYVNGVQDIIVSNQTSISLPSSSLIEIGRNQDGSIPDWNGFISNFRIVKGTAVYTATFTPPTAPLTAIANTSLLTAQANTIIDNSSNALTITTNGNARPARNGPFANTTTVTLVGNEGSAYFDGTGDRLSVDGANPGINLTTNNFTLECWVYFNVVNSEMTIINKGWQSSSAFASYLIYMTNTASLRFLASSNGGTWDIASERVMGTMIAGTWTHIAVTRSGTTFRAFINGVINDSFTFTSSSGLANIPAQTLFIGGRVLGDTSVNGYISNVRIVNGTALYTNSFIPSFAPSAPVANTVLLTAQTNVSSNTKSFIDESNFNNIITPTGNTALGSSTPFSSTWSGYFDGSGDYLQIPHNTNLDLGSGAFTVEFWMNASAWSSSAGGLVGKKLSDSTSGWQIYCDSFSPTKINARLGATNNFFTTSNVNTNVWEHWALVRTGSTLYWFKNGVLDATGSSALNISDATAFFNLGYADTWSIYGNFYISNLRIVKGTALYTANFTPSTTPLVPVANTVLLTCNSNRFVDYSAANNVITRNGDAVVSKFSPFNPVSVTPASYSNYFDGTGDYLTTPANANIALGSGAFTIEAWVYIPTDVTPTFGYQIVGTYAAGSNGWSLVVQRAGSPGPYGIQWVNGSPSSILVTHATYVTPSTWNHIAVVRASTSSNQTFIYLNGILVATGTDATNDSVLQTLYIGSQGPSNCLFLGYISNLRIVKGTAVYTSNFTPSTTPLTAVANTQLLTCQSTTFIDNSTNNFAITVNGDAKPVRQNPFTDTVSTASNYSANTFGSSIFFDSYVAASQDFLSVSGIPISTTGQFTLEAWIYVIQVNNADSQVIYSQYNTSNANRWTFNISTANKLTVTHPSLTVTGATTLPPFQWNHVAVTRDASNTLRIFLNGVVDATSASYTYSIFQSPARVGYYNNTPNDYFNGYMSSVRVVNGQALYTRPFIPSDRPLPTTANTSLLLASTVGPSTVDATGNHNIETFGTARRVANNSPYYDTYSVSFDGTGDYLSIASNSAHNNFGTSDFGIEGWFYFNNTTGTQLIFSHRNSNAGAAAYVPFLLWASSGTILLYVSSDNGNWNVINGASAGTVVAGQWYHIAYTRTGNTFRVFVNGVQTYTFSSSASFSCSQPFQIGMTGPGETNSAMNGYVSNIRMIKGTSPYSANFTPSTSPLTAVANTVLLTCQSNRFIDNSTNALTITKFGDAKITAFEPFVGSNNSRFNSVYFPTKTDYLAIRPQPNLITFPGDFTFECWVYPTDTSLSTLWGVWDSRNTGASSAPMVLSLASLASPVTGSWRLSYYNGTSYYGTGTVLWNQWTHVAWVRSGSTMTFYVNGVAGGTAAISGTQAGNASGFPIFIGSKDNGLAGYGTIGYIADFRITNGAARTITVPTVPYDIK